MSNARNVVNQIVDDIVKDATRTLDNVTEYDANRAADDWERIARHVMDAYYSTETAGYYERTFLMRDNTIKRILEKDGDAYKAGAMFDWSVMSHGDVTSTGEFWIGKNFLYGYHGNENYTVPGTGEKVKRKIATTSPSAQSVLDRYYENYGKQVDRYFDQAIRIFGK
jgi:hypothetical protein